MNPWDPEGAAVVLDPQGRAAGEALTPDPLGFYRALMEARALDQHLEHEVAGWISSAGEEAPVIALGLASAADERIFTGFRDHALPCVRGLSLADAVTAWRRWSEHGDAGFLASHSLVEPSASLGMHLGGAAGCAHAHKLLATGSATFVSFGEGLTTTGPYYEALMAAVANDLPLVFVCRTQLWPEPAPAEAGVLGDAVADRARSCGLWTRRVDGADPFAVYAAVHTAAERARNGRGPGFVEAVVTPLRRDPPAHRDPIERLRRHLEHERIWTTALQQQIAAELAAELASASASVGLP